MIELAVAIAIILLGYGWLRETGREPQKVKRWRKHKSAGKRKGGRR